MTNHRPRTGLNRIGLVIVLAIIGIGGVIAGVTWHEPMLRLIGRGDRDDDTQAKQLWTCGMHPQVIRHEPGLCPICHMELTPVSAAATDMNALTADGSAGSTERKVKYWWDPMMNPPYISDQPGKSPMGMDLIPVYEGEIMAGPAITIDPVVVQNMGVRVATVTQGPLERTVRAVAILKEAETNIHDVNLRVSGWIERLHAHTEGMLLRAGDPLFELYSPELQVAVGELIASAKSARAQTGTDPQIAQRTAETLLEAAKRKLRLWGLTEQQIDELADSDQAPPTVLFTSPIQGHLVEKHVVQGAAVTAGDRAMRIVDHSTLWLDAQVFEQDLPFVSLGQKVSATIESMPGRTFDGQTMFIHPHVDPATRTAQVRIELTNPELTLRPGMYATMEVQSALVEQSLLVPREAVIDTGERQVAFVALGGGHFEPRQVEMGLANREGMVQVLRGLAPGESVVTSGQFLLDSESRLKEAIQKHLSATLQRPASTTEPHTAHEIASTRAESQPMADIPLTQVDAVVTEYLKIAEALGAPQASNQAINADALIQAAKQLIEHSDGELRPLIEPVANGAERLAGRPLDEQREFFKPLSDAMIALVKRVPPSRSVTDTLYIAHCPMAPGNWLQTRQEIANPYYATTMKACGEIKGAIQTREDQP